MAHSCGRGMYSLQTYAGSDQEKAVAILQIRHRSLELSR